MKESVIYQDIFQKGELRGKQKEAITFSMILLDERFGEIDSSIIARVKVLNREQLKALCKALLRISSLPDLLVWLDQHERD